MKENFDLKAQKKEELAIFSDSELYNKMDFKAKRIFELKFPILYSTST